ncbi:UDP-N-acetylmuramate dehydrogenase [Candidatus Uhrbacteria bacterium]|nr:UDP-N-acetylmuramate dehydrogenase [Candidatus Uhrbacteria bacterium]
MNVLEHISLASYTTFRVGGAARFFAVVSTEHELEEALAFAKMNSLPVFILGGGSNIVVSDEGFSGIVIKNEIRGITFKESEEGILCTVGGGENWDAFVSKCVGQGLSGLELLSGIPGTVGAAPVQNIGAYGASIRDAIQEVRIYDRRINSFRTLKRDECGFSYRSSIFKENPGRSIISKVIFRVSRDKPQMSAYPDLAALFDHMPSPSASEIREAVIKTRAAKGMVIMDGYESYRSAGSFFKNSVISKNVFDKLPPLSCRFPWFWELPDGRIKVAAACLIQQTGFEKGYREGEVGLSSLHTLAIVNYGGASARQISDFANMIQDSVEKRFGIVLEPEVQFVGF